MARNVPFHRKQLGTVVRAKSCVYWFLWAHFSPVLTLFLDIFRVQPQMCLMCTVFTWYVIDVFWVYSMLHLYQVNEMPLGGFRCICLVQVQRSRRNLGGTARGPGADRVPSHPPRSIPAPWDRAGEPQIFCTNKNTPQQSKNERLREGGVSISAATWGERGRQSRSMAFRVLVMRIALFSQ